jgi:AmmeMemoRadiSam system protein B
VTTSKRSRLAGTWYPAGATPLRATVDGLLHDAEPAAVARPLAGLVVPHAGYQYSGRAAAVGYRCLLGGAYRRALILAPSHYSGFRGAVLLDVDAVETPLGRTLVDRAAVARLAAQPLFAVDPGPFEPEHSLEIQLPFLQQVLPPASVIPVLLGRLATGDAHTLAAALRPLADAGTIVVVSSDFTHYGWRFDYQPFPATGPEPVRDGLRQLDMGAIDAVCDGDARAFDAYVERTGATICGQVPIAVFLSLHARRSRGRLLAYYTSLDITGDYEHSVSYAAIAFPRPVAGATP